jgi:predicted CxxxxCH...CXXCH cytochrome family protein
MSSGHWDHVGQPSPVGTGNSREFACTLCHYNYDHNQSDVASEEAWPGTYYDNVNIDFDPSWNPDSPTYAGAAVPTTGNGGTGVCAGLYCHGNNATLNAGWGGAAQTPSWNGLVACGACHVAGSGFTPENHPAHLSAVYGPGIAAYSVGGDCSEGAGCHPKYDLTPLTTHVNNAKDLRSTATDNGEVGASLAATQVCRNCHSTTASSEGTGDTLVRNQANWDNTTYKVPCLTCHNDGAQGTQNLDGSGNVAHNIDGTYNTRGHGDPSINDPVSALTPPVACTYCHAPTAGHIGAQRPVSTNPWRIGISNFNLRGRVDEFCGTPGNVCHSDGADHWWRVDAESPVSNEIKASTDTHPTTTPAVPTSPIDKSRWFQVPLDGQIPLHGNLTDNAYDKSGGSENHIVCVSCHDPHGVPAAVLPAGVRTFSGANNDNGAVGRKMLRYDFSSGTPTVLCSMCHK